MKLVIVIFFENIENIKIKMMKKDKYKSDENSPSIIFFINRVYKCGGGAITQYPPS